MTPMPTYAAFLRAINLGANRKFPKADLVAATEAAGGSEVDTYIASGNVRLTSPLRSTARVEEALEEAFVADRGFAVPTMVLTMTELVAIAREGLSLAVTFADEQPGESRHYVSLLKTEPSADAVATLESLHVPGERAWVRGRAVHIALNRRDAYHSAEITNALIEKQIGVSTNRNLTTITELARRWGGAQDI
jgi:uncharacterized protein (DUF1697 family)